jgi:hypothetical protein
VDHGASVRPGVYDALSVLPGAAMAVSSLCLLLGPAALYVVMTNVLCLVERPSVLFYEAEWVQETVSRQVCRQSLCTGSFCLSPHSAL